MANTHANLSALFTAIANAIRTKTDGTEAIVADQFPDAIAAIDTQENLDPELSAQDGLIDQINTALAGKVGKELPVLSNPAGAANIEAGYQVIDGDGKLLEGTAISRKAPERIASKTQISWKGVVCAIDADKTYFVTVKIDSQWHACIVYRGAITDVCDYEGFCSIVDGNLISSMWSNAQFIVYEC